jgi:hypothetical protein
MRDTTEHPVAMTDALRRIGDTHVGHLEVSLGDLRYSGGTRIGIGNDHYDCDEGAWTSLCSHFDLPPDLLPELGPQLGDIVFRCINADGRRSTNTPEEVRFACDGNGRILAVAPSNLVCLPNAEVVQVIETSLPRSILSETLCARLFLTPTAFELDLYTKRLPVEPRPGDILYGGVSIRHSQAGVFPTVVLGYIYRLVCTNGMTQRVCLAGKPARTKRSQAQNTQEPVVDAIREQIEGAFGQLESRLEGIRQLTEHRLDIDELPDALRRRWSINRQIAAQIAAALHSDELGRTFTEYDLVNALSRVATHNDQLALRYRRHLALAAGMFAQRHIHQCPQCGTWLHGDA